MDEPALKSALGFGMDRRGAAAVIIGNEVLSAKVEDQNGPLLARRLRDRGVPLRWMAVVPDEVDVIVEALQLSRARAQYVFTSGGIGPTHDDVTVRAVALALGRPVVRQPEVERLVRQHYGEGTTPEALRLADAPEGTTLLWQSGIWYPVLSCSGVFLLPGVPQLFRVQLETVLAHVQGNPIFLRSIYLSLGEAQIARALDEVALSLPDVSIGSYPVFGPNVDYRVKVTVEHADEARVLWAVDQILARLPTDGILRVEGSSS
jgi:molybdenum cofactor synthesis domain-containing protein